MNIYTVRDNLRNTIAGKEAFAEKLREEVNPSANTKYLLGFLAVNLMELRGILKDVEACCENATAASWAGSVDRQGGAFEDFETRNRDGWIEP